MDGFKYINRDLGFGPTVWQWPEEDEKLVVVFDHIGDIDKWLEHCEGFEVAVQAGGACGIWPLRLSLDFDEVHTFEPQPDNFECLVENCQAENVTAYNNALSNVHKRVSIHNSIHERKNYGAGYIVDDAEGVDTVLIDDLDLEACDLICLDIEGAELDALKGAEETIRKFKPLIVIEDKPLPHMAKFHRAVGDPGTWLARFGYEFKFKDRWDSVYKC